MHVSKFSFQEFDKTVSSLGIIFSILLIIYSSFNFTRIIYIFPGIFTLLSCTLWLLIRKNLSLKFGRSYPHSWNMIWASLIFVIFTLTILIVYFRSNIYERPLIYFILITLIVGMISIEIICSQKSMHFLLLIQIILVGISLAWSQLLIFPSLLGIDPRWHQMFTSNIMQMHFIPQGYAYSKLPVFHLLISLTSLVSGLNYKFATMFSVSLFQIVCNVMFVFLLGRFLFNNDRVGLLASLLVTVANHHIYMSYWSIPTSFAAIFLVPIFYVLLKTKQAAPLSSTFISMIFMITLIFTHTITSMCMAIILFVFSITTILYSTFFTKTKSQISLTYATLFSVVMFAWWTYASGTLYRLGSAIKWGFSLDTFMGKTPDEVILKYVNAIPLSEQIFNNVGMFLFFSSSFIGLFYMISKKYGNNNTFSVGFVGIMPLILGFFSLITQHSIIEHRWFFFAQILLSFPLAIAFLVSCNKFEHVFFKSILLSFSVMCLSFFLIFSPVSNIDNPTFSPNSSMRYALTSSELQALNTTSNMWVGTIKTDRYFSISKLYVYNTKDFDSLKLYEYNSEPFDQELYEDNFENLEDKLILLRKEIIGKPFIMYSSLSTLDFSLQSKLDVLKFSKIYDCDSVYGYLK